jgi:hypothetical protein
LGHVFLRLREPHHPDGSASPCKLVALSSPDHRMAYRIDDSAACKVTPLGRCATVSKSDSDCGAGKSIE